MSTIPLQVQQPKRTPPGNRPLRIALVGNPNCGKTTLFNRLTGLRAKTSNFPGTTLECRTGKLVVDKKTIDIVDLPGLYSTQHAQSEELLAAQALHGGLPGVDAPDAVVVVIDATCLARHLYLASEVREMGIPLVIALTMMDQARQQGVTICLETLGKELDAVIVPVSGRTGEGIADLSQAVVDLSDDPELAARQASGMTDRIACTACSSCPHTNRHTWACGVGEAAAPGTEQGLELGPKTEAVDKALTHPLLGLFIFAGIMYALFFLIFRAATYPMDWIDAGFGWLGDATGNALAWIDLQRGWSIADSLFASFLIDGVIGGVGGVVIFLPQILILFFVLTLLEDTGYLARAALVMDRIMNWVGLPGKAFIPMLSAHACAIPAIMSTKVIESRRDRLITILVLPLMTCSARLPVYAMVAAMAGTILYPGDASEWQRVWLGTGLFFGAYTLGIVAAMGASLVLGKTVLKGKPQELVIELPPFRWPSLRVALLTIWDRGLVFLKQAGTVILLLSILIWAAMTFPQLDPADMQKTLEAKNIDDAVTWALLEEDLAAAEASGNDGLAEQWQAEMDHMQARYATEHSIGGRLGKAVEPVFAPLGFDWRIDIGVVASFAAREVVVSTLAITAGIGEDGAEDEGLLSSTLGNMKRPDGSPLFDLPTLMSLLVFFVLAMQCLPTQAVTKRETGSWKWAILQFGYMTVLAYVAALVTYQVVSAVA
ncbi:MAG: ferrous iron transporter B [Planctomycetota bacterium]